MLGTLKYHADPSKADPEYKSNTKRALDVYMSLSASKKQSFLMQFKQTKGKDFSQTVSFTECDKDADEEENSCIKGWFTRAEILVFNKLSEKDFSDEAEMNARVSVLIAQAKADFPGYEPEYANNSNPRLAKTFYQKHLGTVSKHTSSHSAETTVGASGSAHKFDLAKEVEELAGNDSSVAVKVENTGVQACKSRVANIKKQKRDLETQLNDMEDIVAELAERKSSDSSLVAKLEEGENCVASLRVFVKRHAGDHCALGESRERSGP